MQTNPPLLQASLLAAQTIRQLIHDLLFCHRHRANNKCFTRCRLLPFMNVAVLLLQKTVRSIQLHLNDFFQSLALDSPSVAPASWCEARLKLCHTAFVELNQRAVLDVAYGGRSDFAVRRWMNHRLLAIDSSLVRLPNQAELGQEFGWVECSNQAGSLGRHPQARLSVLTDLLNGIALHTLFVPWQQGERSLALNHLLKVEPGDVTIMDRGYASYELFAHFVAGQRLFVCRCQRNSFSAVAQLCRADKAGVSVVVTLRPSSHKITEVRQAGLPEEIQVRFVTVRLSTGELEILATNLLDEVHYPTEDFSELYHYRWGVETFFGKIKGRLDLGNFSGLSLEAVRQDLFATILLSNLESILIQPTQQRLDQKPKKTKHPQQINHAVSFHAIKSQMIALLLSEQPVEEVLEHLERLFLGNPVSQRPNRKVSRKKTSGSRSCHFQRNIKKSVF